METSLHRQLKSIYADDDARLEVPVDGFRIDVVSGSRLVEIQHGSLAAIRDKVRRLLKDYQVLVVKPLVIRKRLMKRKKQDGPVVSHRLSPKRGSILDLFDELVYFTRVFPHRNLSLEVPLVEIEEWRFPGHGRRRWRRDKDYQVEDQILIKVVDTHRFCSAADLTKLIPKGLPSPFESRHLAELMQVERWVAQRIAYCLRETGAIVQVGKKRNARLYDFQDEPSDRGIDQRSARVA